MNVSHNSMTAKNPYLVGDVVVLLMDNPHFHRMLAVVVEPTEYGAEVEVESRQLVNGKPQRIKWKLRCVFAEMVYIGTLADKELPNTTSKEVIYNDQHRSKSNEVAQHKYTEVPLMDVLVVGGVVYRKPKNEPMLSGDECKHCGKFMMVWQGKCKMCLACNTSEGSCS